MYTRKELARLKRIARQLRDERDVKLRLNAERIAYERRLRVRPIRLRAALAIADASLSLPR